MVGVIGVRVNVGQGVRVAVGGGGVYGVRVGVGVAGVLVGRGVLVGTGVFVGRAVRVGVPVRVEVGDGVLVAVGSGVGGSPSTVKLPATLNSWPTKIWT